jgi:hypothetical protein
VQYELNANQRNNLYVFLNRVPLKGLEEVQAMSELLNALSQGGPNETEQEERANENA